MAETSTADLSLRKEWEDFCGFNERMLPCSQLKEGVSTPKVLAVIRISIDSAQV